MIIKYGGKSWRISRTFDRQRRLRIKLEQIKIISSCIEVVGHAYLPPEESLYHMPNYNTARMSQMIQSYYAIRNRLQRSAS